MSGPSMPSLSPPGHTSRAHSGSFSSVHFADQMPSRSSATSLPVPSPPATSVDPARRLRHHAATISGVPSAHADNASGSTPNTPAPTPRANLSSIALAGEHNTESPVIHIKERRKNGRARHGSLINQNKRASVVTGGYESSSPSSSADDADVHNGSPKTRDAEFVDDSMSRRRARSLMCPPIDGSSSTPIGRSGSDRSLNRRNKPHRLSSSRQNSRDMLRPSGPPIAYRQPHTAIPLPPSRVSSHHSTRSPHLSGSRSDHLLAANSPAQSRSESLTRRPLSEAGSRQPSTRIVQLDRLKREEITSSPDSGRGRKGKERAEPRRDVLASSLGLGRNDAGATLTAEQIHDLLADTDVASALRLMSNPMTKALQPARVRKASTPTPPQVTSPTESILQEPFLVSAPPPLLQDESTSRDRGYSVSTTASTPQKQRAGWHGDLPDRETLANRRRRASSRATGMEGEGGHVAFTHHLPPTPTIDQSDGTGSISGGSLRNGEASVVDSSRTTAETLAEGMKRSGTVPARLGDDVKEGKRRKRLSALFGLKRKPSKADSSASLSRSGSQRLETVKDPGQVQKEADKAEKEAAMREKERARREEELSRERYYRALQQVAAHPHASQLADRAKVHIWAHYEHVFDGLDNPPRLNPLAVIRWRRKVDEEEKARRKWNAKSEQGPRSNDSLATSQSTSFRAFNESRSRVTSGRSSSRTDHAARAPGWEYTVEDVAEYKACEGRVEYFIPPRQELAPPNNSSLASVNELTALEHPDDAHSLDMKGSIKTEDGNLPLIGVQGTSVTSTNDGQHRRPDSRQSVGEGASLSRSPSVSSVRFNSLSGPSGRRSSHRPHHSLGHIGPIAIGHALKAPFDKLNSIAKRQRTMPMLHGDGSDSQIDETPMRGSVSLHNSLNGYAPASDRLQLPTGAGGISIHSTSTAPAGQSGGMVRSRTEKIFSRSREGGPRNMLSRGSLTDDERRDSSFRKLFVKGERQFLLRPKRDTRESVKDDKQAVLADLENAVNQEASWRLRLAEQGRRPTLMEEDARRKIREVEGEIYAERSKKLKQARITIESGSVTVAMVDDCLRHYLAQITQMQHYAKGVIGKDLFLPNLDKITVSLASPEASTSTVFPAYARSPLSGSASESEAPNRRAHQATSLGRALQRGTKASLPNLYGNGSNQPFRPKQASHHSPKLTIHEKAERVTAEIRDELREMDAKRSETADALRTMEIDMKLYIQRRAHVERWVRRVTEEIDHLRSTRDTLIRQSIQGPFARFSRQRRELLDTIVNRAFQGIGFGFRTGWRTSRVGQMLVGRHGRSHLLLSWLAIGILVGLARAVAHFAHAHIYGG